MIPDFGMHETEVEGVKLTCRYIAPGLTLHDLVMIFEKAYIMGNDLTGNPAEWPVVKGIDAVVQAVLEAVYKEV